MTLFDGDLTTSTQTPMPEPAPPLRVGDHVEVKRGQWAETRGVVTWLEGGFAWLRSNGDRAELRFRADAVQRMEGL